MDTIFMNSKNSKTSNPYRLLFNLLDKINLKPNLLYLLYTEKYNRSQTKTII